AARAGKGGRVALPRRPAGERGAARRRHVWRTDGGPADGAAAAVAATVRQVAPRGRGTGPAGPAAATAAASSASAAPSEGAEGAVKGH
ncbi:hypothetical protein AB0I98_39720, partial [Streptomyces sp. NPDC050211]